MTATELLPCPFCGSRALYEGYHIIDNDSMPVMFCDSCKAMVTFEGFEDYVTDKSDGMTELEAAWNARPKATGKTISTAYVEIAPRFNYELMAQELELFAETVREMAGDAE